MSTASNVNVAHETPSADAHLELVRAQYRAAVDNLDRLERTSAELATAKRAARAELAKWASMLPRNDSVRIRNEASKANRPATTPDSDGAA